MNILYIGQYTEGTTSKMRADQLYQILKASPLKNKKVSFKIIDTHTPFHKCNRIWRSIGFRYKWGPLIKQINKYIINQLNNSSTEQTNHSSFVSNHFYDLIWIDKAIFLTPKTTKYLKNRTDKLVHFTPDPAFTFHQSGHFNKSIYVYDFAITTKSYELELYKNFISKDQSIYVTQGFDKNSYRPLTPFKHKKAGVLFIGHQEKERENVLQNLIDKQINVILAGINWESFTRRNQDNQFLNYLGIGIYGDKYRELLSEYQFAWGSISKWIPELHTTRTFEIPACGTALITERNKETASFFNEDEAIFYNTIDEMIEKIMFYQHHSVELEQLTKKGTERVLADGRDYESILRDILKQIGILSHDH